MPNVFSFWKFYIFNPRPPPCPSLSSLQVQGQRGAGCCSRRGGGGSRMVPAVSDSGRPLRVSLAFELATISLSASLFFNRVLRSSIPNISYVHMTEIVFEFLSAKLYIDAGPLAVSSPPCRIRIRTHCTFGSATPQRSTNSSPRRSTVRPRPTSWTSSAVRRAPWRSREKSSPMCFSYSGSKEGKNAMINFSIPEPCA